MPEPHDGRPDDERITAAGCVLTTLSLVVIFGSAIPIVHWRDSVGRALPRYVALASPLLVGAVFHGIGTAVLRLFGLRVLEKPDKEKQDWPEL
jgi:hypothetical protein